MSPRLPVRRRGRPTPAPTARAPGTAAAPPAPRRPRTRPITVATGPGSDQSPPPLAERGRPLVRRVGAADAAAPPCWQWAEVALGGAGEGGVTSPRRCRPRRGSARPGCAPAPHGELRRGSEPPPLSVDRCRVRGMSQLPCGAVLALMGLLFARTMAWTSSGKTHAELVNNLYKKGIVKSQRVFDVLLATDRGHYIKYFPYMDSPQSIGYKATISAPHMTGPTGKAVGVEHIKELVHESIRNVQEDDPTLLSSGRVKLVVGDGRQGYPEEAPYDAIHVGAAAATVPKELLKELKPGGRLIVPVGPEGANQVLMQYDKTSEGHIVETQLMGVIYVPLTDKEKQWPRDDL
ncbi:protein-L-isoaspartate(D-aspartate) O-methyltransferase-like isoform X2 [Agelaius tricolor]